MQSARGLWILEHILNNQIDAVECQGNAKGMHFLEIVGLLRTPPCTCIHRKHFSKHTPGSSQGPTQKPICAGVIVSISKLILRYLGVREWRIHTHYHVTFQSCSRNRVKPLVQSSFESHNLIGPDEVIDFP